MNKEQANRLLQAGKDMRAAQKKYFRTRAYSDLRVSKELETNFDKLLQECSQSREQQQMRLM